MAGTTARSPPSTLVETSTRPGLIGLLLRPRSVGIIPCTTINLLSVRIERVAAGQVECGLSWGCCWMAEKHIMMNISRQNGTRHHHKQDLYIDGVFIRSGGGGRARK